MSSIYEQIDEIANLTTPTRRALEDLKAEWAPDLPPSTVAMSSVARSLVAHLTEISEPEVKAVFKMIESMMAADDEEVRSAASTGFLEALLGQASAGRIAFTRIAAFLGEKSREYCRGWDKFTGVVTNGLE